MNLGRKLQSLKASDSYLRNERGALGKPISVSRRRQVPNQKASSRP